MWHQEQYNLGWYSSGLVELLPHCSNEPGSALSMIQSVWIFFSCAFLGFPLNITILSHVPKTCRLLGKLIIVIYSSCVGKWKLLRMCEEWVFGKINGKWEFLCVSAWTWWAEIVPSDVVRKYGNTNPCSNIVQILVLTGGTRSIIWGTVNGTELCTLMSKCQPFLPDN